MSEEASATQSQWNVYTDLVAPGYHQVLFMVLRDRKLLKHILKVFFYLKKKEEKFFLVKVQHTLDFLVLSAIKKNRIFG